MSEPDDYSRRALLRQIGISLSLGAAGKGVLAAQDVEHVHQAVREERAAQKGPYQPKGLTKHEFATLVRLSDLIIPADEHSPGALAAHAAEFIDFLCSASGEMKEIYTGGIGWLDWTAQHRGDGDDFLSASAQKQIALLDLIAGPEAAPAELEPGARFFDWARKMVVDAFYTSPIGIRDLGYQGNTALAEFHVPQEAIDYAIARSPFA